MNAKDHFIEWLRDKILRNPAEPPPASWQEISDSLDLEDSWDVIEEELELDAVWEKVDARLHHYSHLVRFEKISQKLSLAALALLFLPFIYMPAVPGPNLKYLALEQAEAEQEETQIPSPEDGTALNQHTATEKYDPATGITDITGKALSGSSLKEKENKEAASPSSVAQQPQPQQHILPGANAMLKEGWQEDAFQPRQDVAPEASRLAATGSFYSNIETIGPDLTVDTSGMWDISITGFEQAAIKDPFDLYPSSYIGAGTALKLSSLLNSKTWHAMERSSLLSSAPTLQQDLYILYGQRLARRLFIQADVYLQDRAGQQYNEYRGGTYTSVQEVLNYQSAGLSLSWLRKQLGYGRFPLFVRWTGGLYGGRLLSAEERSGVGKYTRSAEYSRFHAGLLAGYEYDVVLHPQLMLSYGVFGRTDLFNIYSGTELIPAAFRKTRAASIDFRLTIRYTLKK